MNGWRHIVSTKKNNKMTLELEKQLIEKYPKLFKNINKSPKETLICFGAECGDGWFDILDNLCGFITNLQKNRSYFIKKNDGEYVNFYCPDVVFDQIKEKYGTLRVYWHFGELNYAELGFEVKDTDELYKNISRYSDTIESAIDFCEYLSSKTCEVTGKPGKLYSRGWCVTLCKEEAIKRYGFDPDEDEDNEEVTKL
jgi:hypothetical protein